MTRDQIFKKAKELISHSAEGLEVESPKIDFKTKWYDLKTEQGKNEFIKDITSIANTIGLDGFIVIGYNDRDKKFSPAKFEDSGLKDTSEIPNLIIKKCSNLFDIAVYDFLIDSYSISVLHIPPTLEKPIAILNHKTFRKDGNVNTQEQHKIFIRKTTRTYPASKNDIDLMYYDKKNIDPEYQFDINLLDLTVSHSNTRDKTSTFFMNVLRLVLSVENFGRRTIALKNITVVLENDKDSISFESKTISINGDMKGIKNNILCTIPVNDIEEIIFTFDEKTYREKINLANFSNLKTALYFSNGKVISKNLKINSA